MKVLVTGATGYIGGATARALRASGHEVSGLARSEAASAKLVAAGLTPVRGDLGDADSLARAVTGVDAVVSTASIGSLEGDADTFARDRDAIRTMLAALDGSGKTLLFTSGSAVVGVFAGGEASPDIHEEDVDLPFSEAIFAPTSAQVHPMVATGFATAMAARIETEKAVTGASGIRGIVVRPGLVYGEGGSYDIPKLIKLAHEVGVAPHLGAGHTVQGYVHIDDLAKLFSLAVKRAPASSVLHGVAGEVSQRALAAAVSRMLGAGDVTESFTLEQMFGAGGSAGISLSLNKRLSAQKTRQLTGWSPSSTDILQDVEFGSYAS
jgi:nucleoside-diphosphate-sugar epimerase